ncbi:transposase [Micromonospora sp. NPDC005173]|uniref:transposase n=1 Tax=Micromonospora sp. NPDC005173 TaxID=3157165 RepID=UPI0033A11E6C
MAAKVLGHVGDVTRFPTADHFASYAGTSPPPAQPHRQPATQHRPAHHHARPSPESRPGPRLLPAQTR